MVRASADRARLDAVRQHLYRHLGPPGETLELRGGPARDARIQALDIPFFAPEAHVRHAVFATVGASLYALPDGGRLEAMLILAEKPPRARFDALQAVLTSFAAYLEAQAAPLDNGDVVPAEALLAPLELGRGPDDRPRALVLLPPVPVAEDLAHLTLPSGERVDFVWLLPVWPAEAELALSRGLEVLMALFALEGVDPTRLDRRPLDTRRRVPDAAELRARLEPRDGGRAPTYRSEVRDDVIAITRRSGRGKPER